MFWQGGRNGTVLTIDPSAELTDDALSDFKDQMELFTNGMQRYIAAQGGTVTNLGVSVPDPTASVMAQYQFIATSISVPLRIFLGSEQAQLASSQDTANWNSRLAARQSGLINPRHIRPLVDLLVRVGSVPPHAVTGYNVEWVDLDTVSDKEQAEVAKLEADALNTYASGMANSVVAPEVFLGDTMGYSDELIQANEEALGGMADAGEEEEDDGDLEA
jgi:hypothetical protein